MHHENELGPYRTPERPPRTPPQEVPMRDREVFWWRFIWFVDDLGFSPESLTTNPFWATVAVAMLRDENQLVWNVTEP